MMKKSLNSTKMQFLELLKAGLWHQEVDRKLFEHTSVDWNGIARLSRAQTVVGIVYDGIERMPEDCWPAKEVVFKWYAQAQIIARANQRMNAFLPRLTDLFRLHGVNCWVLKGQGLAQHYPNPLHRQSGDIDLLVEERCFDKAVEVIKTLPHSKDSMHLALLHYDTNIDGIEVELHGSLNTAVNGALDRRFNNWLSATLFHADAVTYQVEGADIPVPSANFNAVYVFIHMFRHYLYGGIGLRQVCDWMCLLTACREEIDREELRTTLKRFHLMKAWRMFGCMAVKHLGMPEEAMPWYDGRYGAAADVILANIFENGNFGHNNKELSFRPENYLHRKVHSFYYKTKDKLRHIRLFPEETVYALWTGLKVSAMYMIHGK